MSDLTGRLLAARRASLGLTQMDLAEELQKAGAGGGDRTDKLVRWIQRLEAGEIYRARTAPTRQRYMKVLEILGFDRDEPSLDVLTEEISELRDGLETLRALMLRMIERLEKTGGPS